MNKSMAFSLYPDCTYCSTIIYAKLLNFTNILVDWEDQNDQFLLSFVLFQDNSQSTGEPRSIT